MVEPTYLEEQTIVTFRTRRPKGEVVGPPNAVDSFLFILPDLGVVQIKELLPLGRREVPHTPLEEDLLLSSREKRMSDPPGEKDEGSLSYDELPRADVPLGQHAAALAWQEGLPVHLRRKLDCHCQD